MASLLAIDDEPQVRQLLSRVLEADGHVVTTAANGLDGIRMTCEQAWDLVVLDLALPDLPGLAVLSALREKCPDQRVLVLSAVGSPQARVDSLERGAVDFLAKPFVIGELRARVRARLADAAAAAGNGNGPEVLEHGMLRLDLVRHRLDSGGRCVDLSPREFLVMRHLMRRPGAVCSREELLVDVWGYPHDPGTNVVEVTIGRLRAKLHDRDIIETVRNVGYSLAS